eukprot:TRINITY_DN6102_c0_g1_i2.p1 TRINITY_DN6102_c0_g1~~TRINITY_DN6102_c0_g1_i2.p1  ORF type:complete len:808 (+),score=207.80 TRINITY_DN6102_c0_g1_i2:358-2424(+)
MLQQALSKRLGPSAAPLWPAASSAGLQPSFADRLYGPPEGPAIIARALRQRAAAGAGCLRGAAACRLQMGDAAGAEAAVVRSLQTTPCHGAALAMLQQALSKRLGPSAAPLWPAASSAGLQPSFADRLYGPPEGPAIIARALRQRAAAVARGWEGKEAVWSVDPRAPAAERCGRRLVAARALSACVTILPPPPPVAVGPLVDEEGGSDKGGCCRGCGVDLRGAEEVAECTECKVFMWCPQCADGIARAAHTRQECAALSALRRRSAALAEKKGAFGLDCSALADAGLLGLLPEDERGAAEAAGSQVDADELVAAADLIACVAARLSAARADASSRFGWDPEEVGALEARSEALQPSVCSKGLLNAAAAALAAEALQEAGCGQGDTGELCRWTAAACQTNSFETPSGAVCLVPPPLAWVNHSCAPNAFRGDDGALRTATAIPKGEEICISYIPELGAPRYRRRAALRKLFGFDCACPHCAAAQPLRSPCLRALRCATEGCGEWVTFPDSAEAHASACCAKCGAPRALGEDEARAADICDRIVPCIMQGLEQLGGVDDELAAELRQELQRGALHPFHWALQRAHAALAACAEHEEDIPAAAAHAAVALAGLDAALPAHWPGKAEAALRALRLLRACNGQPSAERACCPPWILQHYGEAALQEHALGLRAVCDGLSEAQRWKEKYAGLFTQ